MARRTLRLTSNAFMRGRDVSTVQAALNRALPIALASPLTIDGEYGPATASHVALWKRYVAGYPDRWMTGGLAQALGVTGQDVLTGDRPLPPGWADRGRARAAARPHDGSESMRVQAVETMRGWADRGWREAPDGSNVVPEMVQLATRLEVHPSIRGMGMPWCALSAFLAALQHGGNSARSGLVEYAWNALYTPTILALALDGRHGMRVVGRTQAQRGDLVMIDWAGGDPRVDHVGRLYGPDARGGKIETIEGNAGNRVLHTMRDVAVVRAFIRDS